MVDKYQTYQIEDWLVDDDFINYVAGNNSDFQEQIQSISKDASSATKISEAKSILQKLNSTHVQVEDQKLNTLFEQINNTLDTRTSKKDKKKPNLTIVRSLWATGIAASLALLVIFNPFSKNSSQEFLTRVGEQEQIILPDNSITELNAVSSISFDENSWDEDRNVKLEGEAFFKVEKGSKFTVESEQGKVSVLGTQFNIYDRKGFYQVECIEGSVKVELKNGMSYTLEAGDKLADKMGAKVEVEQQVVQEIDWLNNYVDMKDMSLAVVLAEVSRYYDVEFENTIGLDTIVYNVFFNTRSLDSALNQVLWPLDIEYEMDGKVVRLNKD